MWDCKRLWLLFFALLYLKDVRALGVWRKRSAQDWYSVAAQIPLALPKEPASFHDGAQMSTAMRNEGFQRQNFVLYAQAASNQDVSSTALQNSYGTPSSVRVQSDNTVSSSLPQQRPQDISTFQTSQSWMQNASSYSGSRHQTSTGSGLSQEFASLYAGQSSSSPAFIVTQPASVSTVSNGSTSSSYSASQSQGSTGYGLSQGLASQFGSVQTQGTTQLSSAPGLTVIRQASPSVVSRGSTSSSSGTGSQSQGSSVYGLSQGLASQYGYGGFQTQQGTTWLSSAPGLSVIQPSSDSVVSSGSAASTSSSYSGSQSPSVYWQSPSSLSSQHVGSQGQQSINQMSSAPGLTVLQQATPSVVSSGSTSSASSSYTGSQSQGSTGYGLSQGLASQFGRVQTQQGTTQLSSAPGLSVIQPSSDSAVSNGSSSTSSSYSISQSQGSTVYGPSQGLASQYGGFQTQQGTTWLSSAPGLTVIQQASPSVVSRGSTSSTSSSGTGSQNQGSSVYGLSQGLASQYGYVRFQTQQGINQPGSVPAIVTQPASDSAMSNGSSMSSFYSGSQSPSTSWLSLALSRPSGSVQTHHGITQLGSLPGLSVTQPSSDSAVSNGSSSTSSSYSVSQSQGSTVYGPSQGLASQYGGFQTQQGTTWLSSAPGLTVIQQASPSVVSRGSTSSTSSSGTGSQNQGSSVYGLSQGLASQYGYVRFQTQQGINQPGSVPAIVTQPASDSAMSNGSSMSSFYSGSQSPSTSWLSLALSRPSGSVQTHHGITQLGSLPGLSVTQPSSDSAVSNGSSSTSSSYSVSQSQGSTVYGPSQGLASRYGGFQTPQGTTRLSSAPGLSVIQPAPDSAVSSGSAASTSSSYSGSQSPSAYWQSLSSLSSQYVGSLGLQGMNQISSAPGLTVLQQATPSVVSSSISSSSSSYPGSQSQTSTGYGLSQWLASRYGSFQTRPGTNQLSSLTVTQQVPESGMSSGPVASGISSSSLSGSQSPSSSWLSLGITRPYSSTQTQHGINQRGSAPGLTVIQPASDSAVSNGSATSISGSYSGSQSPSTFWQSLSSLSSQNVGSQRQQSVNQLGTVPRLTVIQPASDSAVSSGSAASTSSSGTGSQSQGSSVYGPSQGLASQFGRVQTQQGTTQLSSAPGLTVIRPASPSVVSRGSTSSTSSSYSGSQSQGSTGLPQGLASQTGYRFQTQQGINHMSSAPSLTVTQQASPSVVSSGATASTSGSYSGSQSPSTSWLSLALSRPSGSSQTQHGVNQLGSVIQLASDSVVSNGSATSTSSSYSGSQSQGSTGLPQGLASQTGYRFQTQQGTTRLNSAPGLTMIQQASPSVVSSGSTSSTSSTHTGSQSRGSSVYGLSRGLASQSGRLQMQQGTTHLSSAPGLTVIQQASPSVVSSGTTSGPSGLHTGSQSQSATGYWSSRGLSSRYDLQTQQSTHLNQQASSTLTSSHSNVNTSNTYSASQNPSLSQAGGSYLGVRNQNIQKPGAFNQQVPALWMGRYSCKNGFNSSSDISKLS
ncbi:hypothetical protein KOW79_014217 [Hemibagrus wyckioides]|uniref:Mucin-19-like n=1 Tax=Hemibagrus wyckioides TaxID=337641 RepID=A0A9D3NG56_9TELE|nr:mucin-12-like [Hemibagrus wyckioides]KAG7322871.1 hypothetical protein KOW79_014217 [Hemibagrus wyckioides]